ncbi:hypothetical protein CspHIS471_0302800 [Cutaneotrichosporon sp. HIS471]|nr:hypothetical protein CspHIS471_0302800 [Cutaneotrichosporon sp. HIS471]
MSWHAIARVDISTSHLALAAILLFSLLIILYRPFQTSTLDQPLPNTSPRPVLPLLSPPLTPTMVFTTPKASPSPMSDRSVSGAPELVGSFVEKYKDIKSRYEEAQAKADKYERLYLELKVRADELAELEASLPTVKRLEAELEHEARLRQKATDELEQLKREQEELLAMHAVRAYERKHGLELKGERDPTPDRKGAKRARKRVSDDSLLVRRLSRSTPSSPERDWDSVQLVGTERRMTAFRDVMPDLRVFRAEPRLIQISR